MGGGETWVEGKEKAVALEPLANSCSQVPGVFSAPSSIWILLYWLESVFTCRQLLRCFLSNQENIILVYFSWHHLSYSSFEEGKKKQYQWLARVSLDLQWIFDHHLDLAGKIKSSFRHRLSRLVGRVANGVFSHFFSPSFFTWFFVKNIQQTKWIQEMTSNDRWGKTKKNNNSNESIKVTRLALSIVEREKSARN